MKKFIFPAIIIAMLFVAGCFTSCNETDEYNYFLVKVDDLTIPDVVFADQPFEVKLSGTIGHNGCSSFERFIIEKHDSVLLVEAWGKLKTNVYTCPDAEVELDKEKFKCTVFEEGIYVLKVKQPDGTYLERQIDVR